MNLANRCAHFLKADISSSLHRSSPPGTHERHGETGTAVPERFSWTRLSPPDHLVDGLSVDLEDYYQVEAFAANIPRSRWPLFDSRARRNTARTLELLARHGCRATFFVLGWLAEREPGLVREVAEAGHELACHSHLHRPLYGLKPSEFREDLRCSRDAIENAGGTKVVGFRAPTFSITQQSMWALEVLAEEGFEYDSSIFPIHHDHYGVPSAPRWVHQEQLSSGKNIWELPPSTVRIGSLNLPFGGGGYLRQLPMFFTRWAIRTTHRREKQPVIVYFHPWELDPDQPRLTGSWKSRLRHYRGLDKTADRLAEILSRGTFQPLLDLVRAFKRFPQPANEYMPVMQQQKALGVAA